MGEDIDAQVGEDIGGSIEVYDPGLNQWRMQGTMQDARLDLSSFVDLLIHSAQAPLSRKWGQSLSPSA